MPQRQMLLAFPYTDLFKPTFTNNYPLLLVFVGADSAGQKCQWARNSIQPTDPSCFSFPQSLSEHRELSPKFFLPHHLQAILRPFSSPRSVLEAAGLGFSELHYSRQ